MPATSRSGVRLTRHFGEQQEGSPSKSMMRKSRPVNSTWPRWKSPCTRGCGRRTRRSIRAEKRRRMSPSRLRVLGLGALAFLGEGSARRQQLHRQSQ